MSTQGRVSTVAVVCVAALPLTVFGQEMPASYKDVLTAPASPPADLDTAKLAQIVGHTGDQSGAVYKITVGRTGPADQLATGFKAALDQLGKGVAAGKSGSKQ